MIDALLAHLAAACPDFAAIEDATRLNPLERDEYPVVTLYLASETPDSPTLCARYRVTQIWDLLITANSGEQLATTRAELKSAMRTFTASGVTHQPEFVGGQMAAISGPLLQWRDSWRLPLEG